MLRRAGLRLLVRLLPRPMAVRSVCARWNSHYLIPQPARLAHRFNACIQFHRARLGAGNALRDRTPLLQPTEHKQTVIGRYAFAVYDEGGLIDVNVGGFPTYANLTRPTRPARRLAPKYPVEESEIMLAAFTPNARLSKV